MCSSVCSAQEPKVVIPDSIKSKNYQFEELYYRYYNSFINKNKKAAAIYASTYIEKAKIEKDTIRLAEGYYSMSFVMDKSFINVYMDSIIVITKNINDTRFPSSAYFFKGSVFYNKRAFKKALDNYILANDYARKNYNPDLILNVNHDMGLLKDRLGNYKEALRLHKENYQYLKYNNNKENKNKRYLNNLFGLATCFYRLKQFDSAFIYNSIGLKESIKTDNVDLYNDFVICAGVLSYFEKDYQKAVDSIRKSLKYYEKIDDKPNKAVAYYYLGKIYYESNNIVKAISYLKRLDTIFQQQKDVHPETREGYEILINHYKEIDDPKNQLLYIEKLMVVDSVLNDNYRYLQKKISSQYDTPLLLSEKQKIITVLEASKKRSNHWMLGLVALITIAIGIAVFNYRKRNIYQQRFQGLLDQQFKDLIPEKTSGYKKPQEIGISEEVVNAILKKLQAMEDNHKFLTTNLTITSLSKQLKTNPNYLSKIVNTYKGKRFGQYINELRINYVITRLQSDPKFRKYTVKAIAQEIGFNSQDAFSKAFYKSTGIHPSYFIKELEKKEG
ncbi:tetratricopeptide repeat protein [uncultured Aquimarina sp.]|uniref:tetratricopeptide repeat protein n=1 Tax=uncultured Aquimarina sp. TaxID=575652 RepID=UPI002610A373|nr:tetratricopeptide repeat protein [uncultured Aquimarina sp.]